MARLYTAIVALALVPLFAFAASADLPAGFAPNSIWISSTNIVAGDTINIFTVVYNSSAVPLTADVDFMIDSASVGTKNFSLKAGETQIESVPWTAVSGNHAVMAQVEHASESDTSANVGLLNHTTDTITFSVGVAVAPSGAAQAAATAASTISTIAAQAAPAVQSATNWLEGLRENAVQALETQLASSSSSPSAGKILGAATPEPGAASTSNSDTHNIFSTIWLSVLSALLYVCRIQVLFYAGLLVVIYIAYKLIRAVFAERSHHY